MNIIYYDKRQKKNLMFIIKISFFIIVFGISIIIGIKKDNILYNFNSIKKIDVNIFKTTINNSYPIIDFIYNSGKISISFRSEAIDLTKKVFGFNLKNPITILSTSLSIFNEFYINDYQKYIEENYQKNKIAKNLNKDGSIKLQENQSSITYEDDTNKNSNDNSNSNDNKNSNDNSNSNDINSNNKISAITIHNETNNKINIDELLNEPLNMKFDKKGPKVLIYHTHTTESFLSQISQLNNFDIPVRNSDPTKNVVRVGEELAQNLRKKYNIDVIHNGTVHILPSDVGAYGRSLNTATNILKSFPSIKMVFDVHRDGLGNEEKLRILTKINNKNAAKLMFVVGTDGSGLEHPNWKENLKLALKLQNVLNSKYPGFVKPIFLTNNRYNQHLNNGTLIVEIGGNGNLLEEVIESTKYLAEAINDVIN